MDVFVDFLNHFIPFVITLVMVGIGIAMFVGTPYCRYVAYVAQADTHAGKEQLARYLASKTGGRKINVEDSWRSFLPAARDLHRAHMAKRNQMHG